VTLGPNIAQDYEFFGAVRRQGDCSMTAIVYAKTKQLVTQSRNAIDLAAAASNCGIDRDYRLYRRLRRRPLLIRARLSQIHGSTRVGRNNRHFAQLAKAACRRLSIFVFTLGTSSHHRKTRLAGNPALPEPAPGIGLWQN